MTALTNPTQGQITPQIWRWLGVPFLALIIIVARSTQGAAAAPQPGDSITVTNRAGKVFTDVRFIRADSQGIVYGFREAVGGGRIAWNDLPDETALRFGHMPDPAPIRVELAPATNVTAEPFPELSKTVDRFDQKLRCGVTVLVTNDNGTVALVRFVSVFYTNEVLRLLHVKMGPSPKGYLVFSKAVVALIGDQRFEFTEHPKIGTGDETGIGYVTEILPEATWQAAGSAPLISIRFRCENGNEEFEVPATTINKLVAYCRQYDLMIKPPAKAPVQRPVGSGGAMKDGVPIDVYNQIAADARKKWPGEYNMQVYEINKQTEAYRSLHR